MDFSFHTVLVLERDLSERASKALNGHRPARGWPFHLRIVSSTALALGLVSSSAAFAAGDPNKGAAQWEYLCDHCHGTPQPHDAAAFKAYGKTANPLSVYASNPAAITKAITVGYTIPKGNTNDDYEPGTSTARAMESFVGMGEKRMGVGDTPTQYAIDISAYLASYFDEPGVPTIGTATAGNAQATVSFSAPKSDLPITSYTVTANPGGIVATGTVSPIVVTGLSSGVAYTFTVKATSNAGTGKPSSASNAVTPTVAQQAVAVHSTPAVAAVAAPIPVAPALAIKPAVPVPAPPVASSQMSAPKVASAVVAATAVAAAPPVIAAAVKPVAPVAATSAPAMSVPAAATKVATAQPAPTGNSSSVSSIPVPTIVAAKPGNASARVFFTIQQNAIPLVANYSVVAFAGKTTAGIKATGTGSPITVTGLTNGTDYTFTVTANGKSGGSATSVGSNVVTPLGIFGE